MKWLPRGEKVRVLLLFPDRLPRPETASQFRPSLKGRVVRCGYRFAERQPRRAEHQPRRLPGLVAGNFSRRDLQRPDQT